MTGLDDDQVSAAIEKIIQCYRDNAKPGERLGKAIDRLGLPLFQRVLN